ncbi:Putative serine/threonine-protein kinase pknH [Minicystis rosea]|nr:Putative serine/threonine-protein kinase pknH [Minicystis rosea]
MNRNIALALLTVALLPAACDPATAEPITTGGATSSSSSGGAGGDHDTTSSSTGGAAPQGDCQPACASTEVCVESSCHAVVELDTQTTLTGAPCNIVTDADNVYWQIGEVRRVAKTGGQATSFGWTTMPASLVVDDTHLYWTGGGQGIRRADKHAGQNGQAFGSSFADQTGAPTRMTGDGTRLYYFDGTDVLETDTTAPAGTTPTVFSPNGLSLGRIAADATGVYYWGSTGYTLVREDKATHDTTVLSGQGTGFDINLEDSASLVVDGDTVFYSTSPVPGTGGIVARVSIAGGESTVIVDAKQGASGVFAVDEESVYFMSPSGVFKVAKTGGLPILLRPLDPPSAFPTCVAVDSQFVYWVDGVRLVQYRK